jgi:cyclopropane-fatty-acyl-phospholipid synthase
MLLHTITAGRPNDDWDFLRFSFFIRREIFPGGEIPPPEDVIRHGRLAGLEPDHVESLRPHYARTLDCWARNLEQAREAAIKIAGEETYDTYMKYLTGCANLFRSGEINLHQFKFRVA